MKIPFKQERGMALIVSLVILILVTVASVAAMESTGMQLKMSNASRDRQEAFEATEAALRTIEENVNDNITNLAEFESMYLDCDGDECFKPDCANGRCFQGIWRDGDPVEQCKSIDDSGSGGGGGGGGGATVEPPTTNAWETGTGAEYLNVWDDAASHQTVNVDGYDNPVKYIVEFRCFTAADPAADLDDTNYAQIFRITARGMSNSDRIEVMLQSTYKRTE